jgi:hypothetical protein
MLAKLRYDPVHNTFQDCIDEDEIVRRDPTYVPSVYTFPSALAQLNKRYISIFVIYVVKITTLITHDEQVS